MAIEIPNTFDPLSLQYQTGNQPEIFSQDQYDKINKGNYLLFLMKKFCIDRGLGMTSIQVEKFDSIIDSHEITVIFGLYDLILPWNRWQEYDVKCTATGKKIIVITDNYFDQNVVQEKFSNIRFYSRPKLLGITSFYHDMVWPESRPGKLYNCFIQRVDSVRQSWLYFLHNEQLIENGYLSFLLRQYDDYFENSIPIPQKELFKYIHYKYQLDKLPNFDKAYHELENKVPFRNFPEINDLLPTILDTKYSLVLETVATEDSRDCWSFTEKLMRSIQVPNITLFFAQKNSFSILTKLGFKLHPELSRFDHMPWQVRQREIIKILKKDSLSIDHEIRQAALHNASLLKEWETEILDPCFFDDIWNENNIR